MKKPDDMLIDNRFVSVILVRSSMPDGLNYIIRQIIIDTTKNATHDSYFLKLRFDLSYINYPTN